MSLRKKILLMLSAIAVMLIGFLYLASRIIVLDGFAKVEAQATQENVGRALAACQAVVGQMYLVTVVAVVISQLGKRPRRVSGDAPSDA